jgi:hypothetical protein
MSLDRFGTTSNPRAGTSRPSPRWLKLIGASSVAVLITFVGVLAEPARSHASDGATLTSTTVYRFDPLEHAVFVEATYKMTNTTPNRGTSDGGFRYFFFTGTSVPIDPTAAAVAVTVNGNPADFSIETEEDFSVAVIDFRTNLRYQKTATIVVTYQLVGQAPRTPDAFDRVNDAYASFPVYGYGDPGEVDITVQVPKNWMVDHIGDDFGYRVDGEQAVYEATGVDNPLEFGAFFTARNDDALVSTPITAGTAELEIRSWPNDPEWLEFAKRHITEGLPILEKLAGSPWPESEQTDVIETSTPYLRGYAGYYFSSEDQIEVGEELDSHTLLHELSHVWFNSEHLTDRWLSEGLAEEVSSHAVAELGEPITEPQTIAEIEAQAGSTVVPFALNDWERPNSGNDDAQEAFGYATAFTVIRDLSAEIGADRMADLLAAVVSDKRAYQNESGELRDLDGIDWREFLDLAEQVGGSRRLTELYRAHVIGILDMSNLDARDDVVPLYRQLVAHGGDWIAPEAVRAKMASWNFHQATDLIEQAESALEQRDRLVISLDRLTLTPTAAIEEQYQNATSFDALGRILDQQLVDADRLFKIRGQLDAQLGAVELATPELTQADYDADPIGIVDTTQDLLDDATSLSNTFDDLAETLAPLGLTMPNLAPTAFVDDRSVAQATLESQLEAANAVAAAHRARDAADSLVEKLGLFRSDVDRQLERADAALSAGKIDQAATTAEHVIGAVDELDSKGAARLRLLGITFAVLLVGLIGASQFRRRRRPSLVTSDPGTEPGSDPDTEPSTDPSTDIGTDASPDSGSDPVPINESESDRTSSP